ncbi:hypothetical protein IV203_017940 [Nitzschia inconspicua]|uniref:Uncharacterized protein n=2 Tax=Nitzschia inconspicua TaxID=303405 RepID=A0A9K3M057_9STRA|nr:hypothetical protein IV203_017940 [Nitzschia inconspicua]
MKLFVSFTTSAALVVAVLDVVAAKKYSYRSTGLGGSATMYSEKCGEWPFGSYLDVYTSQYTYKVNAKGKPETSPAPYWYPYFYIWLECTDGTTTKIELDWDWFESSPSTFTFPNNNKLQTGLVSGSILGRKLSCTIVSEMYDDEEYFSYDCDYDNWQSVTIDLSVTWTGVGSTEQRYMLAGPIGAMVLPLTDDAPKVTKEILGHALELTIHHPTIGPKICKKWITVDTIIDAIRAAAVIDASMGMNARLLNILLSKIQKYQLIDRFDGSNLSGFFRAKYSKQSYYIILPPGEQAEYPLFDKQWKEEVERVKSLISFRSLKSNDIPPVEHLLEQEKKGSSVQRQATYCVNPQNTKSDIHERQQDSDYVSMPKNTKSDSHERQQDSDHVDMPRQQSVCGTYWDSPEAYKLFRPRQCDSNCLSAVERRIKLLQRAQQFEGWRDLVHGRDPDNVCSNYDKLVIRQKSMFILKAYQIATLEMNRKHGSNAVKSQTREAFLHPNLEARVGRDPLPPFLRMFPDTQRMNWSNEEPPEESTEGPFNLSVQERRKRRSTQLLDEYVNNKPKTKKELTTDLQREGWVGEPKGLLQVARERGLIDHNNHHLYSANPKKNPDGTLNDEKSLRSIVGQCTDFQNELTHLQVMANELKVQVMFTPKFHAEMAGEGIEYSWGFAKGSYRRKPLQKKRKRSDFEDLVDECTNVETELTKARIRKFSARARAYLCTYHYLATAEPTAAEPTAAAIQDNDQEKKQKVPMMDEIERLMKKFKTHRCAFEFDRGFVMDHGSLNPTSHTEIREL